MFLFCDSISTITNFRSPVHVPAELLVLLLLVYLIIILWDFFDKKHARIQTDTGLSSKATLVALQGSNILPNRTFISNELGLSSTPDALLEENGFLIPIDIKPLSKKIQDRHVTEMMVHLRLIEENTGKTPPYGILLMGPEKRRVEIKNLPEKQRHLETIIDEMHSILAGVPAIPKPSYYKCKNCDVNKVCKHSALKTEKPS